jgi:uncharacterized Zn-finger protein
MNAINNNDSTKAVEIVTSNSKYVFCLGAEAPFDHPKIFLEIDDKTNNVDCPYCSKRFILE